MALRSVLNAALLGVACFFLPSATARLAWLHALLPHHQRTSDASSAPARGGIYDLVTPFGYPLEHYTVQTDDGYQLGVFRIPYGAAGPGEDGGGPRPAVLLQHGLLDSCAGFLINGPNASLAFILADAGYDVWLGNARGSTQSRSHAWLDTGSAAYWAFSWDEMAKHDLPAMVQHVLRTAGVPSLAYVGHSQGTLVGLAALSSQPQLQSAVSVAVLLAPVTFAKHISSIPITTMAALGTAGVFVLLGVHEFLPSQAAISQLEGQLCTMEPSLCVNFITAIAGYNADNIDQKRLPLYVSYTPAGTSVQNMAHWSQMVVQASPNTLSYFDYGISCLDLLMRPLACNRQAYGTDTPPRYDLGQITTPVAIFAGGKDILADPTDVEYLVESLRGGTLVFRHDEPDYEHLDFIWGINAPERVYGHVLDQLRQYSPPAELPTFKSAAGGKASG